MKNEAAFLDTNIFVYSDDGSQPKKQARAIELITVCLRNSTGIVSLQVIQEYFAIATRKLGVAAVVRTIEPDVIRAIELHRLRQISFWDALIVRAAELGGADVLYSEDLHDGGRMGSVRVENPFRAAR